LHRSTDTAPSTVFKANQAAVTVPPASMVVDHVAVVMRAAAVADRSARYVR